jgi:hypothetical protein
MMIDARRGRRPLVPGAAWLLMVATVMLLASCGQPEPDAFAAGGGDPSAQAGVDASDPGGTTASSTPASASAVPPTTAVVVPPTTTTVPTTVPPSAPPPPAEPPRATDIGGFLAPMGIDDRPQPWIGYDRGDWPHWADTDGDGCDARQQALIAASITPAQVDFYRCTVVAGDWYSAYDGVSTDDSSSFDVDHLVPLRDAHWSGGWRWNVQQRRLFANDQSNLWVVSASSNRSKGALTPDQWRPARTEVWCEFAIRWVQVKVSWGLTATSSERNALGSMLERCDQLPAPSVPRS